MDKKIKIIVKDPGNIPHFEWISDTLDSYRDIVGGYIEAVTLTTDFAILCNEEGRLMDLPYNCEIAGIDFVGTIIGVGVKGEEFADVPVSMDDFRNCIEGGEL